VQSAIHLFWEQCFVYLSIVPSAWASGPLSPDEKLRVFVRLGDFVNEDSRSLNAFLIIGIGRPSEGLRFPHRAVSHRVMPLDRSLAFSGRSDHHVVSIRVIWVVE
jgi:hypothetical protein